jgi:hypothetical protein
MADPNQRPMRDTLCGAQEGQALGRRCEHEPAPRRLATWKQHPHGGAMNHQLRRGEGFWEPFGWRFAPNCVIDGDPGLPLRS